MSMTDGPVGEADAAAPEPVTLMVRPDDQAYLDRRAANDCGGDRSAALRRIISEARTFRHDLRGKLGALDLIEMCLTSDAMTPAEAAQLISHLRREIGEMIMAVRGPE